MFPPPNSADKSKTAYPVVLISGNCGPIQKRAGCIPDEGYPTFRSLQEFGNTDNADQISEICGYLFRREQNRCGMKGNEADCSLISRL